jgi:hypothetical protein
MRSPYRYVRNVFTAAELKFRPTAHRAPGWDEACRQRHHEQNGGDAEHRHGPPAAFSRAGFRELGRRGQYGH